MSGRATIYSILFVALLLASTAIAAESFTSVPVTVRESILPGETAVFEFHITNTHNREDRYTISSLEYSYILFVDPRPTIAAGATGTYGVEINPRSFVNQGTHRVPVRVRSIETGETEDRSVIIFIRDPASTPGQYVPSVALSVGVPQSIDPREGLVLNVHLRNRNPREYTREDPLTVTIESDIFRREYTTQLGGVGENGEKTSEIRLDIDPYQAPGTHPLVVRVKAANRTVSEQTMQFEVKPYSMVEQQVFEDGGFFSSTTTYRVRNEGNVADEVAIVYPINILKRPFLSASDNYQVEDVDGDRSIVITRTLDPLEETTVTITENYRLLALLIVLAILSIIGYFLLRSPVVLGKEASISGSSDEGVSEIRVRVLVKNRSAKTMRNLRVIDRITGMAEIVREETLGTVRPTKIVKKKGQGTLIRWDLDQLEPFEERIITYRAKSPLKLVGDVTLPAVKVKYDLPSGRERTTHSNEVNVSRG